jgi:hypothetical protein
MFQRFVCIYLVNNLHSSIAPSNPCPLFIVKCQLCLKIKGDQNKFSFLFCLIVYLGLVGFNL